MASVGWFFRPLEWNIDSALPDVPSDLHAVAQSANGKCLWIAGANALLAYSSDQGRSWKALDCDVITDPQNPQFRASTNTAFPCASGETRGAGICSLSILPKVYAAEKPPADPKQQSAVPNATNPAAQQRIDAASKQAVQQSDLDTLAVDPQSLFFGKTEVGVGSSRTLSISNRSTEPVKLPEPSFVDLGAETVSKVADWTQARHPAVIRNKADSEAEQARDDVL